MALFWSRDITFLDNSRRVWP